VSARAGSQAVSVVIPAFDAERYLREAIESVLAQTLAPAEVVVVDDGSADATAEVAAAFGPPVRCLRRDRAGVGAALNAGIHATRGELLAFLDADDYWLREKLELQVRALSVNPQLDFVLGHVSEFRSPDLSAADGARLAPRPESMPAPSKGTMLIRREAFIRVGPFATDWTLGEFVDWYARAVDAGLEGEMLPDVVMMRRLHRANSGIRDGGSRTDYVRVVRTILERRGVTGT
jgi:glycosyltransferase involved in cell wall biosynthesis